MNDIVKVDEIETLTQVDTYPIRPIMPSLLDNIGLHNDEKQFLELINLGLNKKTLNQVVERIENGKKIKNIKPESEESNAYLAKILREEVQKQFSEGHRPLVELVLNGIDARPSDSKNPYVVDIRLNENSFEVTDSGKGMSLQKILDTLIIPFSSDKDELIDIGRFGIGFFSSLQYCLERPKKANVTVRTSSDSGAYELKLEAKKENVEDLICRLRKIKSNEQGTTASVSGIEFNKNELIGYLSNYLGFFDPKRAVVRINGEPINIARKRSHAYGEYHIPVKLNHKGKPIKQHVRVAIDCYEGGKNDKQLNIYSQGIFIQKHDLRFGRVDIDFPSGILPVEGRDELRRDDNYWKCFEGAFKALLKYGKEHKDSQWILMNLREIIPAFIDRLKHSDEEKLVKRAYAACFPQKTFLGFDPEGLNLMLNIKDFLGDDVVEQIYSPKSNVAHYVWRKMLPSVSDLIKERTEAKNESELPEICRLELDGEKISVSLKDNKDTRSPVFIDFDYGKTYINVTHPLVTGKSYAHRYGFKTAIKRQMLGDKKMEGQLIQYGRI